ALGQGRAREPEEVERRRELLESVEAALAAPDERDVLDLAEAAGERDAARGVADAVQAWTRDLLVAQAGGAIETQELGDAAARLSQAIAPPALLGQASLCADVIEALDQNGNGRLQLERLLLGIRELRRG